MGMSKIFTFDGYTVRPVGERDRGLLAELIEGDPYHRGRMTPDFFLKTLPGEDAWALEDETGHVVFYFRTSTAVRMAIQFQPTPTVRERARNRRALMRGLRWIAGVFRQNLFHEIIFDTEGPELRTFAKRRLGGVEGLLLSIPLDGAHGEQEGPVRLDHSMV
jgi:hypothetical protein